MESDKVQMVKENWQIQVKKLLNLIYKYYEKCGFDYIDKGDLGVGEYGLKWFDLYEKLI